MTKEYIYLGILALFLCLKIIPVAFKLFGTYKLLGYKRVIIKGYPFIIKKIDPLEFLEEKSGFPLTYFNFAKGKTMFEQMRDTGTETKLSKKEIDQSFELAKVLCEKAVVYFPLNLKSDDFFKKDANKKTLELCWILFNKVLKHNLSFMKKTIKCNKNYIIHIAELCAKFGQRPSEILGSKKITDNEKYIIDNFFYNTLLEKENSQTEKQNQSIKRNNKKRGR